MKLIYTNQNRKDDTFRELISMWNESGFVTIEIGNDPFVWVDKVGDILLYDHPRIDDRPIPQFRHGLFGNTVPSCKTCHSWIFWGRRPKLMEEQIELGIPNFSERTTNSIFLGKVENHVQLNARTNLDWSTVVEQFSMPILIGDITTYPFTQVEYLEQIKKSKFGLVLPGYGPKCNREIEYMGLGTVPIFTPGTDTRYHEPLIEGEHYFYADSLDKFDYYVESTSESTWSRMSRNCTEWYDRNCSRKGSFETTKRILETL